MNLPIDELVLHQRLKILNLAPGQFDLAIFIFFKIIKTRIIMINFIHNVKNIGGHTDAKS